MASLLSLLLGFATLFSMAPAAWADTSAGLQLEKSVWAETLNPGGSTTYHLKAGCSSSTSLCVDAQLVDEVPEPLVIDGVTVTGVSPSHHEVTIEGNKVTVDFFEPHESGEEGIRDGSTPDVYIEVSLPEGVSPEQNGLKLTNRAELTADNADPKQDDADLELEVPVTLKAGIDKAWSPSALPVGATAPVTLSLTEIANRSNLDVDTLVVTEPSNDSDPFAKVELQSIGTVTLPEGATKVQVDALTAAGWVEGDPAATAALPNGVGAEHVTGLRFTFSGDADNSIVAGGTPGAITLETTLREGVEGPIDNEASAGVTHKEQGDSDPATSESTLTVEPAAYKVGASKSINPAQVVEGYDAGVTIGAVNESNQALKSLTLTETDDEFFGDGVEFARFTQTPWPTGATGGSITVGTDTYQISADGDGNVAWPTDLPASITGFAITFTGVFEPGATVGVNFDVTGVESAEGPYVNTVEVDGEPLSGDDEIEPAQAHAPLRVVDPIQAYNGNKSMSYGAIEGAEGDELRVTLETWVDQSSNVPVTEIVQEDVFSGDWKNHFEVTGVTIAEDLGADTVLVEYLDGTDDWETVTPVDGEYPVPADADGIRVTYTKADGFSKSARVRALLDVEVTETIENETRLENVLVYSGEGQSKATVTADTEIKVSASKSWNPSKVVIKPTDARPESTLTLRAQNDSTYAVNSLTLTEPYDGTDPFEYLDITGLKVTLDSGIDADNLKVTLDDGSASQQVFTGQDAVEPQFDDWNAIVGLVVSVENDSETVIPRGKGFTVTVDTQLREQPRLDDDSSVAEILGEIDYTIDNTIGAEIARGEVSAQTEAQAPLLVETRDSVVIEAEARKSFDPASGSLYAAGGGPNITTVQLGVIPGSDKPDVITFEDVDPRFWNAFDFHQWNEFAISGDFEVEIEYLTGRDFDSDGTDLSATDGTWETGEGTDLPAGVNPEDVQGIRITVTGKDYETLGTTQRGGETGYFISFDVSPRELLRSGEVHESEGVNPGETEEGEISNAVNTSAKRLDGDAEEDSADATYTLTPGEKELEATKRDSSGGTGTQVSSGGEITYVFTITNTGAEPLTGLTVTDLLPADIDGPQLLVDEDRDPTFETDSDTMTEEADEIAMTIDYEAEEPFVRFVFPDSSVLMPGEMVEITLPTRVRPAHTEGWVENFLVVTDGEGDARVEDTADFRVVTGQSYESRKLVRELAGEGEELTGNLLAQGAPEGAACTEFEGGFYRYPCVVETQPGGQAEWKLTVKNTGNVPADELEILDILPWVGDTGVHPSLANISRGSEWTPTLTSISEPIVPEGMSATLHYYEGDPEACRPTGPSSDPWQGCDDAEAWSTTTPDDLSTVTALKWVFTFDEEAAFEPLDEVELRFITTSALEWPEGAEAPPEAWNSFAYKVRAMVNGRDDYRGQEPNKTGITYRDLETYAIGDYVWIDSDRDGVQGDAEEPLPGVEVELYDADGELIGETTTDDDGRYLFDNLPAGEYRVKFTLTEEQAEMYTFTERNATNGESTEDSDADPATGWTRTIKLDADNEELTREYDDQVVKATRGIDPTWDAGVIRKAVSVGDYVWVDSNRDGLQDEGEPGIPGVTLCLIGPDGEPVTDVFGEPVGPVVTDEEGKYSFDNLPALTGDETYTVCIDQEESAEVLEPYVPTEEHAGEDREVDSSTWTSSTEPGDLHGDGDRDPTLDFGFITKSYAIGDYVWIDRNRNGVQDDGEQPLEGVTVTLTDADGEPVLDVFGVEVEPATTDAEGRYMFDNLPAGEYKVRFELTNWQAAIYRFTMVNRGDEDSTDDSDADQATGWTRLIVLDESNPALTNEYDREFGASEGIDPTWDAGVILRPFGPGPDDPDPSDPDPTDPVDPEDPTKPGDPSDPSDPQPGDPADPSDPDSVDPADPKPGDSSDSAQSMPNSGLSVNKGLVGIALALLVAGGFGLRFARRES